MAENLAHERVEKIDKIDKITQQGPELDLDKMRTDDVAAPTKVKFEEAIERAQTKWDQAQAQVAQVAEPEKALKPSPMDALSMSEKRIEQLKPVTVDQIVDRTDTIRKDLNGTIARLQDLQSKGAEIQISRANDALVTDKLIHVDRNLKTSLGKAGVEVGALEAPEPSRNPLVRYLNYLTNSDRQMDTLVAKINGLDPANERLKPEQLLAIQVKLNYVQQQIEFFTNVLNKAVEGTKTIMNVQV